MIPARSEQVHHKLIILNVNVKRRMTVVRASVGGEGKVVVAVVKLQVVWEGLRGRRLSKVSPIYE